MYILLLFLYIYLNLSTLVNLFNILGGQNVFCVKKNLFKQVEK